MGSGVVSSGERRNTDMRRSMWRDEAGDWKRFGTLDDFFGAISYVVLGFYSLAAYI